MVKKTKNEKMELTVTSRTAFGKKLRKLRYTGVIPANIFGPDFKSTAVSAPYKDFLKTYRIAKETAVIFLKLDKEEIPVLIKHIQKHPVTDSILHIDFRKIDLKQKVITAVPVKTVGTSEAVSQKAGVFFIQMNKLTVEALPQDIPQVIEIDISSIKEIGREIKVSDLAKSEKYLIKDDPIKVVISVIAHKEESITPETTAATPEVITEKAPVEGEAPVEAGKTAPKAEVKADTKAPTAKPAEKK